MILQDMELLQGRLTKLGQELLLKKNLVKLINVIYLKED